MALRTPLVQTRNMFHRDWGNYATAATLPNAPGFVAPVNELVPLEAGDNAYVIGSGAYQCVAPGVPGDGLAVWVQVGVGASVIADGDGTTPSAPGAFATLQGMSAVLVIGAGSKLDISFSGDFNFVATLALASTLDIRIAVDGAPVTPTSVRRAGISVPITLEIVLEMSTTALVSGLAPGSHTVTVEWTAVTGSSSSAGHRTLIVREVRA